MEGNLRFKVDWPSLIVRRKLTVFALFYFVFEGNFQVQSLILCLEGRFNGGFFCVTSLGDIYVEGLVNGGAYFRNLTVNLKHNLSSLGNTMSLHCIRKQNVAYIFPFYFQYDSVVQKTLR